MVLLKQPKLGAVTPVGGLALIGGWLSLVVCELVATHDPSEVHGIFQDRHASNASGPWGAPRFVVLFDMALAAPLVTDSLRKYFPEQVAGALAARR